MLRYVSTTEATVWVETDVPCTVEVLGHKAATFSAEGHNFALIVVRGLTPGCTYTYEVLLDSELCWPPGDSAYPPCRLRTLPEAGPMSIVFGSCRLTAPNKPPYTLSPDTHELGCGVDALYALALRLRDQSEDKWPDMLLLLGDQVYADQLSPQALEFVRARRDTSHPPGEGALDFEEYTRLYCEAWGGPELRWLFSTIPTAMIFDDHDVHDDWNTSEAWINKMRSKIWWHERITSALSSYWVYQHLGNLSPDELDRNETYLRTLECKDAGAVLRQFASDAECEGGGSLWSFSRDLGTNRLIVLDGREGRVLHGGRREMVDEKEWRWIEEQVCGEFDHLLVANTLPVLLAPSLHYLEAWNEAVCGGVWGKWATGVGERVRQALDLEHWAAFQHSFNRLVRLISEVGAGERGRAPASILLLGGDVHQAYLEKVTFGGHANVTSSVYQATCSPFRNPLDRHERALLKAARSPLLTLLARALARSAGVAGPQISWRPIQKPTFDNQLATLELDGPRARLRIERTRPGTGVDPAFETSLQHELV